MIYHHSVGDRDGAAAHSCSRRKIKKNYRVRLKFSALIAHLGSNVAADGRDFEHFDVMILGARRHEVSVVLAPPRNGAHHGSLVAADQLSRAREAPQVPDSHLVRGRQVQVPGCTDRQGCDGRFASLQKPRICVAGQSVPGGAKRLHGLHVAHPQIPDAGERSTRGEQKSALGAVFDRHDWPGVGQEGDGPVGLSEIPNTHSAICK